MLEEQDMIALRKILTKPKPTEDSPQTFRELAEGLFPGLQGISTSKYPPAVRLRGRLSSKSILRNLTDFYKAKRMHWPLPSNLSQNELEFLQTIYSACPQEQQLRSKLTNFLAAGTYTKVIDKG